MASAGLTILLRLSIVNINYNIAMNHYVCIKSPNIRSVGVDFIFPNEILRPIFLHCVVVTSYNNIILTVIRRCRVILADAGHHRRGKELLDTEDSDFFRCKQASRKVNHLHRVFL